MAELNLEFLVGYHPKTDDGMEKSYDVYAVNALSFDVVLDFEYLSADRVVLEFSGIVNTQTFANLGKIDRDNLNERPQFKIDLTPITTDGSEETKSFVLKVKPSSFFKKMRQTPLANIGTYLYQICRQTVWKGQQENEDLSTYTRRMSKKTSWLDGSMYQTQTNSVERKAHFSSEIDLHIEKLSEKVDGLSKGDKLHIQLNAFESFLEQAILLEEPRIFVIHGVGKGRLRDEIATRLIVNSNVVSFKNEFHPNYGFGATEIILKK